MRGRTFRSMVSPTSSLMRVIAVAFALAGMPGAALAVQPDEVLSDPALETRARSISAGLRCLVCQNQSIDDSDAPLAADLRRLVRERLTANDTDEEVVAYIVARYGDFVLLKPPLKVSTILLWLSPILVLMAGLVLARRAATPVATGADATLTDDEHKQLARILKAGADDQAKC